MIRREFLLRSTCTIIGSTLMGSTIERAAAQGSSLPATRWQIRGSEGFDAIAFTGALSGGDLYLQYYGGEAAEFGPKLPADVRADLAALRASAEKTGFGLLWPTLALIFSGIALPTIEQVIAGAAEPERLLRPNFQSSRYWDEKNWSWFTAAAPRLRRAFEAMRNAGFAQFRSRLAANRVDAQSVLMSKVLSGLDVIQWQRKLTGREFDPEIDIVLVYFSKPHGVRVQGQRFLQSLDYSPNTTARIAAHEMLHPSVDKNSAAGKALLAQLARDPLIIRIVKEHDPRWGYTSLEGYLDEDLCQALDQLIDEELGIAHNPAERWHDSDDGMHVLPQDFTGFCGTTAGRSGAARSTTGSCAQSGPAECSRGSCTRWQRRSSAARLIGSGRWRRLTPDAGAWRLWATGRGKKDSHLFARTFHRRNECLTRRVDEQQFWRRCYTAALSAPSDGAAAAGERPPLQRVHPVAQGPGDR